MSRKRIVVQNKIRKFITKRYYRKVQRFSDQKRKDNKKIILIKYNKNKNRIIEIKN